LKSCKRADVVVYDSLVNIELLRFTPEKCEHIDVGKRAGRHTMSQEEINQTLVEQVREGKQVVRLKGGDPFVFAAEGRKSRPWIRPALPLRLFPGFLPGWRFPPMPVFP
jgi:siroheme synthase